MRTTFVAISVLSMLPFATQAESMRCGKWVVSETSAVAEILEKCGEPQKKDVSHEDVLCAERSGQYQSRSA